MQEFHIGLRRPSIHRAGAMATAVPPTLRIHVLRAIDVAYRPVAILLAVLVAIGGLTALSARAEVAGTDGTTRYIVVFNGTQAADGTFQVGGNSLLHREAALGLVQAAGGKVVGDLSSQIGVAFVESSSVAFATTLLSNTLIDAVEADFGWKQFASMDEAIASGQLTVLDQSSVPGGGPETGDDPLEFLQWDMHMIHTQEAHAIQAGNRRVDVGVLDSGIDGNHPDFIIDGMGSNVDCDRGRNSVSFLPEGPGVGVADPCVDNQFHGTHVAGTIAAQANGIGVVGVAPNVTLVPVKTCDASGYCYASSVIDGITYAGDIQLDVINMSFFVDDDEFQQSTELKCKNVAEQRGFVKAVQRAIDYARGRGVTPVAALGNSDLDLAAGDDSCKVIPAESEGVIGVTALGPESEKSSYSSYGLGEADVAAPGGNGETGDCTTTILSTLPGGAYGCIQGTSMASPHAAGVAALIASQFGKLGSDGDVRILPSTVERAITGSTIDIGLRGYDECFGHGRIDALRAVAGDTSRLRDGSAPNCAEYDE